MNVSTRAPRERAWVEVNLANLVANAAAIRDAAPGAALLPMVKANGYGLGAARVAYALSGPPAPWGFGVATLGEAIELRDAGIEAPVVIFTPARLDQLADYRRYEFRAVLDEPAVAAAWDLPYHLEVDTGMGRAGVRWDELNPSLASRHMEGAFTHLHSADEAPESVEVQWTRFHTGVASLGVRSALLHLANSAGTFRLAKTLDLVRPGMFLYGGRLAEDLPAPRPVASVRARVVSTRTVREGESVGYGADWVARSDTTVATIGFGYADGYPRVVQNRADVLLSGARRPVVGRISMDLTTIDAGPPSGAGATVRAGDIATIVGRDGDQEITWEELAGWSRTNNYEALARLGARLPREYVEAP